MLTSLVFWFARR